MGFYLTDTAANQEVAALHRLRRINAELLAALKGVEEWCDLIEQNYPEMWFTKRVRAAIAKATEE